MSLARLELASPALKERGSTGATTTCAIFWYRSRLFGFSDRCFHLISLDRIKKAPTFGGAFILCFWLTSWQIDPLKSGSPALFGKSKCCSYVHHNFSCATWDRTKDLRVMGPTSYRYSTAQYKVEKIIFNKQVSHNGFDPFFTPWKGVVLAIRRMRRKRSQRESNSYYPIDSRGSLPLDHETIEGTIGIEPMTITLTVWSSAAELYPQVGPTGLEPITSWIWVRRSTWWAKDLSLQW